MKKIAIDLMGNTHDPKTLQESLCKYFFKDIHLIFIGTEDHHIKKPHTSFILAENYIPSQASPLKDRKKYQNSSLAIGLNLLKDKKADVFISCGNTGALMCYSKILLKTLKPISRPSLLASIPLKNKTVAIIDVGANIHCKEDLFKDFAILGLCFQKTKGLKNPTIGLLNIGTEAIKGSTKMQKIYLDLQKLSKKKSFSFYGNVEPKDIFQGNIDVLVTDGFSGNIFLKTSESLANFILDHIYSEKNSTINSLKKYLHYENYPGAVLCGIDSLVIKCHRYSSKKALIHAIKEGISLLENNFISSMKKNINKYFS